MKTSVATISSYRRTLTTEFLATLRYCLTQWQRIAGAYVKGLTVVALWTLFMGSLMALPFLLGGGPSPEGGDHVSGILIWLSLLWLMFLGYVEVFSVPIAVAIGVGLTADEFDRTCPISFPHAAKTVVPRSAMISAMIGCLTGLILLVGLYAGYHLLVHPLLMRNPALAEPFAFAGELLLKFGIAFAGSEVNLWFLVVVWASLRLVLYAIVAGVFSTVIATFILSQDLRRNSRQPNLRPHFLDCAIVAAFLAFFTVPTSGAVAAYGVMGLTLVIGNSGCVAFSKMAFRVMLLAVFLILTFINNPISAGIATALLYLASLWAAAHVVRWKRLDRQFAWDDEQASGQRLDVIPADLVRLSVSRAWRLPGCIAGMRIFAGERELGTVKNGETKVFEIHPGDVELSIRGRMRSVTIARRVEGGHAYALEAGFGRHATGFVAPLELHFTDCADDLEGLAPEREVLAAGSA